jgi:hypothetical protein
MGIATETNDHPARARLGHSVGGAWGPALRLRLAFALVGALCIASSPASADWRLYTSADLGYSIMNADVDGEINFDPPTFNIGGSDTDVSPLLGGTVGIAIPMDEIAPLELPRGWRLPTWDVRAEIEATGLRSYDIRTRPIVAGNADVLTEADVWTLTTNFWLDMPMRSLYRPISWTTSRLFGRWRLRTLKYALDRSTFYWGVGIGVASLDVTTREADNRGSSQDYNFAWQAGAGFGYQVSDRVNLSLGYRYLDPGDVEFNLRGASLPVDGSSFVKVDPDIHEVRAGVRVEVWDFATPWR